jgi:tRNA 5-methylaminomethyl-2-thiouridine biosynthesis bifunctional protein
MEAEQVVVCCSHEARRLGQFAEMPLQPVRGQISELPSTAASEQLRAVLCAEGYCAPAIGGRHVIGATTGFDDAATEVREADHADNLAQLAAHMPALHHALGTVEPTRLAGRAAVRCSAPGAMPLVGEVEPGLHCSLAHGTRGLLTSGLAGEIIAAAICGQLPPLPQFILKALSPKRVG